MAEYQSHPDPSWWDRLQPCRTLEERKERAKIPFGMFRRLGYAAACPAVLLDICAYCGHVRGLHGEEGCNSQSTDLFTPTPCDCTNARTGCLFKDPMTLTQPTAGG